MTIEENVLPGGFGAAVLEHLEDAFAEPGRGSGRGSCGSVFPTATSPTASRTLLRAEVGLTGQSVADRVLAATPSAQPIAPLINTED